MKKNVSRRNMLQVILFLIVILTVSIIMHFMKYNETEWLKYFDSLESLNKISKFSFWWYLGTSELYGTVIYIYPIILILISSYSFFKIYHSGFLHNIAMITGYKKAMLFEILKSWKYSLILPIVSVISFVISSICYPNSNIVPYVETDGYPFQLVNDFMETMNPYLFIIIYLILLILFGIIIINIGLCFTRFFKKFSLVSICSFISFIFLENINNLLIAPIIAKLTGITKMANGFSLYNIYYLNSCPNFIWMIVFTILMFLISTFCVYSVFSKKEKVILEHE